MNGYVVFPETARESHPGQVPRMTVSPRGWLAPEIDPSRPAKPPTEDGFFARPILRVSAITESLGLAKHQAQAIQHIVQSEVRGARNELDFRKAVMGQLTEKRVDASVRRVVMSRALDFFKRQRQAPRSPAPSGPLAARRAVTTNRLVVKSDGAPASAGASAASGRKAFLKQAVKKLIGDEGCEIGRLRQLVKRYGAADVAEAIRANGDVHVDLGRLKYRQPCAAKSESASASASARFHVSSAELEPLVKFGGLGGGSIGGKVGQAAPAGAGGAGGGSMGEPPGTRKVWNRRVVEKKPDGKWHVVGHVAGLEGERVPRKERESKTPHPKLDFSKLTEEQAQHLINQLKKEK